MQTESLSPPESAPLVNLNIATPAGFDPAQGNRALVYAESLVITTSEDSVIAQEARANINTKIKTLDEARKTLTRPIDAAKKVIMDFFGGPIALLEQAKSAIDKKVLTFEDEQEQIRKEAQRKLDEAAQRERDRIAAEATERQRVADAEAQRLRDEAAALEAAGDAAGAEKLANKADKVEEKAQARVEVLQDRAASVVAPIISRGFSKASGSSFRDNWKWRLKDISKINSSFKHEVPRDEAIDAIVKSQKGNAESIAAIVGAGIEIYNDRGIASKRA